jgi:hypothetical protein
VKDLLIDLAGVYGVAVANSWNKPQVAEALIEGMVVIVGPDAAREGTAAASPVAAPLGIVDVLNKYAQSKVMSRQIAAAAQNV